MTHFTFGYDTHHIAAVQLCILNIRTFLTKILIHLDEFWLNKTLFLIVPLFCFSLGADICWRWVAGGSPPEGESPWRGRSVSQTSWAPGEDLQSHFMFTKHNINTHLLTMTTYYTYTSYSSGCCMTSPGTSVCSSVSDQLLIMHILITGLGVTYWFIFVILVLPFVFEKKLKYA